MAISRQTQLEPQLEVCLAILDREVETCLASSTGPDLGDFSETVEEEGLLRQAEVDVVGVHLVKYPLEIHW